MKKKLFMDISDRISHTHHEDPYADFNMQPLLPAYLSQQGPGVSWIDYNRDGHDDLLIGTGKGGKMGIFKNRGDGKFEKVTTGKLSSDALGDQTAIIGWQEVESTEIIVGSANLEQEGARVPSAFHYSLGKNQINSQQIPGILSITGPVAAADYDNDGDIDVFIGGEFKPGEYPRNASSRFFNNNNGTFVIDHSNSNSLKEAGLISAAVFTDYDRDGDQDLILSRVWDSILLFENRDGVFYEIGASRGLDKYTGWWKGIATGDFNNDGRPDIVATNIGNNSIYQPDPNHPLKLFYSDFDMDGTVDIIDSYYDSSLEDYVPRRRLYELKSMRSILGIVGSHQKYARSTVTDIFKHQTEDLPFKEINTVQHIVFINQKEGFEARPLPQFSQFSAAIHPSVADFNNDGNEDIFLTQNFFAFANYIPRSDAGRGLLLLGKGDGNFEIIKGQQSGIKVYGEQRGAAVSDFNKDGRADLAISQNQDTTKLYLNQSDKRGIRIQLEGPFWNKYGIGSAFRLIYEDGTKGPLREVQAGSGYRSQQSSVMVLGYFNKAVKGIEVQWFDGKTAMTRTSLESMLNKKEYVITYK